MASGGKSKTFHHGRHGGHGIFIFNSACGAIKNIKLFLRVFRVLRGESLLNFRR